MKPDRSNYIQFGVSGRIALFSDPLTRAGGEKLSYGVPTYEALKGICKAIYWKPTFTWVVDRVRVMNPVRREARGIRTLKYNNASSNDLSYYTYLTDVHYQVEAHFEWNVFHPEFANDRNLAKHSDIAQRALNAGGRRTPFLGTRECFAFVEPEAFGDGKGAFDGAGHKELGFMYHGIRYPDETPDGRAYVGFWHACMDDGVIVFPRPLEVPVSKPVVMDRAKVFPDPRGLPAKEVFA